MGLRCSVLGHRYGERERVEERDERGDEVITAVREVKTCDRCGDELIVTESKEVTAVDPPTPEETPEPEPPEPAPDPPDFEPEPFEPEPPDPAEDDAIILPDDPPDEDAEEWPADSIPSTDELAGEPSPDATDDEEEETGADWPEVEGEDEGFDVATREVDEEVADRVIEAVRSQRAEPEGEDTETGFFKAKPIDDPADPSETDVHAEYYCPRCDWSARSLVTSVRRGDICPDCRRGYVAERDPS